MPTHRSTWKRLSYRRSLTENERAFAREIFRGHLDLDRVWLVQHRLPGFSRTAFVLGHRIYFPVAWFSDDFVIAPTEEQRRFLPVLIHELCHVWQHQHPAIHAYALRAVWEQLRYLGRVYEYNIAAHSCLRDFRIEQQGQIVQDYTWRWMQGAKALAHERVIRADLP